MSINNFVTGGKIWNPQEEKEHDIKAPKRFKLESIAVLLVGAIITASSIK